MRRFVGETEPEAALEALPHLLRRAAASLDRLLLRTLEQRGLGAVGATGLHVLVLVQRPKPVTLLAERLRITPQAMGRVTRRLEGLGLVLRYEDAYDARSLLVELTDDGADLAATIRQAVQDALDAVADEFEEGRLGQIVVDLGVLAEVGEHPDPWHRW